MDRIAIIDGNSLINRAYYAMRNPMVTRDGIYTHAIFGFLNMLEKLRGDYEPEYMVVAFDKKGPTFRHEQYDEYKAGRKKMAPELAMQIPLLKDILDAMNICRIETDGFEADDIIGTVARAAEEQGLEPVIFTGDKDQLQLVTDTTRVVFTKKGVSEFDIYDASAFKDKYGFEPLLFIDFKGLAGDKSDNIPGVPGVGEKSATRLIIDYGTVEDIIAHVDEITPAGLQSKIRDNETIAMMSKKLATIDTHVPLPEGANPDNWKIGETDRDKLIEIYKKLEFNRFLKKLGSDSLSGPISESVEKVQTTDPSTIRTTIVSGNEDLQSISLNGETVIRVFGDGSHVRMPEIEGAALLSGEELYYVDIKTTPGFYNWLSSQEISLVGHDLKKDIYMLISQGVDMPAVAFDTQIAAYVLDSGRKDYSLPLLAVEVRGEGIPSEKEFAESAAQMDMFSDRSASFAEYALKWCVAILDVRSSQEKQLTDEKERKLLYDIELPLIGVMAAMEREGFRVNREFLEDFGKELSEQIDSMVSSIHEMAGEEFNINSPQQLGNILFEKLGLPSGKKTKRGYSTSADVLEGLMDKHEIVPAILEYRSLSKLKSTYIDGLIPLISEEDSKIRAHFMQTVAATGRLSCVEPNLQNIPVREELGREIRKAFVPEEGCVLVGADYSQIELRVLAHMAEDPALIEAFNSGEDIHRATAANVLGIPEDRITIEERSRAKAVNFGVIYGMSSFGLSGNLHITRKDAEEYINAYFEKHVKVREFMDSSVESCKDNGYVVTMFGRKRYIREIKASQFMVRQAAERLAMNSPIQGSAADIIKIAMIRVDRAIREAGLRSRLILQVHDELIINTYKEEREQVEKLLVENMEKAVDMKVALKADLNEGDNWYVLK